MKQIRIVFLPILLGLLCACAGDPVGSSPPAFEASRDATTESDTARAASPPPLVGSGGNTMGTGT